MKNETKYEEIPIHRINTEKQMVRVNQDDDHVIELASSIAAHGLLEPIVVTPASGERYDLVAGAHRLAACKRIGWETIPAMIRQSKIDEPLKGLALIENVIRKDLTIEEEMQAVNYLYNEEKLSPSQICQLLSKGTHWVQTRLQALEYPQDVREHLINESISLSVAGIVAGIKDEGLRNMITTAAINGRMSSRDVLAMKEAYESAENFPEAVAAGVAEAQRTTLHEPARRACEMCGQLQSYINLRPMFVCADKVSCIARCEENDKLSEQRI